MATCQWQHFEHEADIGVCGSADTIEQAFVQVALAMTAVITELDKVAAQELVTIECQAPDTELLLVDWLNALIYEMAVRKMLFSRFEVQIENNLLTGQAWGEPVDVAKHQPTVEIKGATYTELKVIRHDDQWLVQCVLDV